ncbi:MAG TPA: hypothetical protein DHW40_03245 [Microbacterium sp.]|nr:hypothetical protein [Microbacterium sp.]
MDHGDGTAAPIIVEGADAASVGVDPLTREGGSVGDVDARLEGELAGTDVEGGEASDRVAGDRDGGREGTVGDRRRAELLLAEVLLPRDRRLRPCRVGCRRGVVARSPVRSRHGDLLARGGPGRGDRHDGGGARAGRVSRGGRIGVAGAAGERCGEREDEQRGARRAGPGHGLVGRPPQSRIAGQPRAS